GGTGNDTIEGGSGADVCRQGDGTGSQDCQGLLRHDPNDTRGRLDISSIRLSPGKRTLRVRITTFSGWRPIAIWDVGFFVVTIDTEGGAGPEYEAVLRSHRGVLEAHLQRPSGEKLASVAVGRPSASSVVLSVPVRKLQFGSARAYYRWQVESIWNAPPCSNTCFDQVDDAGPAPLP